MDDIDVQEINAYYECPTTLAPTTDAPTTDAPTTDAPTTDAPTTDAPTTDAPTTEAPTTEAPTTEAPTTEAPTTGEPTTGTSPVVFTTKPKYGCGTCNYVNVYLERCKTDPAWMAKWCTHCDPVVYPGAYCSAPTTVAPTTTTRRVFTTKPRYSCGVCNYVGQYKQLCTDDPAWMTEWCSYCDPIVYPAAHCSVSTTVKPTTTTMKATTTTRRVFTTKPRYSCRVCNYVGKYNQLCKDNPQWMMEWCSYCDKDQYPSAHCN